MPPDIKSHIGSCTVDQCSSFLITPRLGLSSLPQSVGYAWSRLLTVCINGVVKLHGDFMLITVSVVMSVEIVRLSLIQAS